MAIYKVGADGKAPAGLKAGDKVVTAGGTYTITGGSYGNYSTSKDVDKNTTTSNYSGNYTPSLSYADSQMSANDQSKMLAYKQAYLSGVTSANLMAEQLRKKYGYSGGVNGSGYTPLDTGVMPVYNPSSVAQIDTSSLLDAKNSYIDSLTKQAQASLEASLAGLQTSYNSSMANYENDKIDAERAAESLINTNKEDVYRAIAENATRRANNGMTNAAQGNAMDISSLMAANRAAQDIYSDRDAEIAKINEQLAALLNNYNINKDSLNTQFELNKLGYLSQAETNYVNDLLNALQYNTGELNNYNLNYENAYNNYLNNIQQGELQKELYGNYSSGSSGGYSSGGYSGKSYSGGSGKNYSSGSSDGISDDVLNGNTLAIVSGLESSGKLDGLSKSQYNKVIDYVKANPNKSDAEIMYWISSMVNGDDEKKSSKKSSAKIDPANEATPALKGYIESELKKATGSLINRLRAANSPH